MESLSEEEKRERLKEIVDEDNFTLGIGDVKDPVKIDDLSTRIPKILDMNVNMVKRNLEVKKQTVIMAVIHEGLKSDNLADRVEEYDNGY